MPRHLSPLLAPFVATALLLSGCGGEDDSNEAADPDPTEDATTTAGSDDEPTEEDDPETTTSEDDPETTTTTEGSDGGDTEGEGVEAVCTAYADADTVTGDLPNDTLEQVRDGAADLVEAFEGVVELAPEEIIDDAQAVADGLTQLRDVVDEASTLEEARQGVTALEDPDLAAAGERLDEWVQENCPA